MVLMGIDCCHYYSHFFVVTMMWSVCNDCNNAVVSCPIVMIVAIVVSFVDSDNMVQKQCHHVACIVVFDCENACVQS